MILPIFVNPDFLPSLDLIMNRASAGVTRLTDQQYDDFPYQEMHQCMDAVRPGFDSAFACLRTRGKYSTSFELETLVQLASAGESNGPVTGIDVILSYFETQRGEPRVAMGSYARGLKFIIENGSFKPEGAYVPDQDSLAKAGGLLAYMRERADDEGIARPMNEDDYSKAWDLTITGNVMVLVWAYVMTSVHQGDWQQPPAPHNELEDYELPVYATAVYLEWAEKLHQVIRNVVKGRQGLSADALARTVPRIKSARSTAEYR